MTNIELIEKVLSSGLLLEPLTYIPANGANHIELSVLNDALPKPLSAAHKSILQKWNGLNLDVIRLYGASAISGELKGLTESQDNVPISFSDGYIVFGDDPAGFVYLEDDEGRIWSLDTEIQVTSLIAIDMDDFFQNYLFGLKGFEFGGENWMLELRSAGLIE